MDTGLTVALWQGDSVPGDIAANLARIEAAAEEAAEAGADLLVMPECFLTGYYFHADLSEIAARVDEGCMSALAALSQRLSLVLVVGSYELTEAGLYNAVIVFDPELGVIGPYRKRMLYGEWEKRSFRRGSQPLIFSCKGVKVGVLICFDVEFPERVRELATGGVELLVVPTALMEPYDKVTSLLVPARAYENGIFVAYANRVGSEEELTYLGGSCIVGPDGNHLARLGARDVGLASARIDTARIDVARAEVDYLGEMDKA